MVINIESYKILESLKSHKAFSGFFFFFLLPGRIYRGCKARDHLLQENRVEDPGHRGEHERIRLSTLLCTYLYTVLRI